MVKKVLQIVLVLGLASILSCGNPETAVAPMSIDKKEPVIAKEGFQLNYNLASGGRRYQFVVEIEKLRPAILFDYTLTLKTKVKGTIKISEKGVQSAKKMRNYFGNGHTNLPDSITTVWACLDTYNEIVETGECRLHDGETFHSYETYKLIGREEYTCEVNGKKETFYTLHIKGDVKKNPSEFWLLDDPDNPLIIRMKVGFEISLKEVFHK